MTEHSQPASGPRDEEEFLHRPTRSAILRTGHAVRRALALFSLLLTALPATGLLAGFPALYRPIPDGAATHPLSLVPLAALSLALLIQRPFARPSLFEKALLAVSGAVPLAYLIWSARDGAPPQSLTDMGINTAIGLLALTSALALRRRRLAWPSILLAGTTGMICLSAFLGYTMGVGQLYGALSPMTLMILTPLVVSAQIGQAHRPMLRTLLGSGRLKRLLRFELALAVFVPMALALVVFRFDPSGPNAADAIYTQAMILFSCTGVLVAGRMRDRLDRERRLLSRELQRASLIDPLTGLANRRGTVMMATHAIHDARRSGKPVSLVICDLDHFKAINDRLGHCVGDKVLQSAANILSRRLRLSDVSGRWGGEEFLFVLPDTPLAGAEALAEILRHALSDELRIMPSGEIGQGPGGKSLTASFGCAPLDVARADGFERALDAADRALYTAKRGGRNRVVSVSPSMAAFG